MRLLVVSSYPPRHCGIGSYARDQVARLRSEGHEVTVISPPDGSGDLRVPFPGGGAFRRAARVGGRYDRVVVHFQPALYYRPRAAMSKVLTSLSLLWLVLLRRVELLVHEADRPVRWRPDYLLLGLAFRRAGRVSFHTRAEWTALERDYHVNVRGALVEHRADPVASEPRPLARRGLGLPEGDGPVFVCPGFLHPSKGFDRAVRSFVDGGSPGHLYIVGSLREPTEENQAYLAELRALCAGAAGVTLVERYLSDEDFDRWVAAADRVVLPYRRSWSSGVLARARALGTPAIVAATGGLAEQAGPGDVVVEDDRGLTEALRASRPAQAAGRSGRPPIAGGALERTGHAHEHEWDPYFEPPGDRTKGRTMLLGLILVSVLLAALAQLTLKHGMNQVSGFGDTPLVLSRPAETISRVASNVFVWLGLSTFAASAAIWLIVLSRASLSFAYPFASLTYVLILLFDRFVLRDEVPLMRWGGVLLIIGGIVLISRTPHN